MKNKPVYVTRAFLPPVEEYKKYIDIIWENNQLTNKGPLLQSFEEETKKYLAVENFQFVTNGTLALQLAINGLGISEGEIITTPFSYVATVSAILWQRCTPIFVDINPETLCIDAQKIEESITPQTKAILAVHVFGNACEVELIEEIAKRHNIKVIYDAAHAFGVKYKDRSLLSYGDVSIVSFHSTKLFHTIEGGGIVTKNIDLHKTIDLEKRFGHQLDEHITLGINAKANEFQAAMGLANFNYIEAIIAERKRITEAYDMYLGDEVIRPQLREGLSYTYAYYPVIFKDELELRGVMDRLAQKDIFPRRYFYPSLNKLQYLKETTDCPVSEDIASKILCLPVYHGLDEDKIKEICEVVKG